MASQLGFTRADFPDDFSFGVATSAYQIEGSSFGGCGPSHWDTFAAAPGNTKNAENGSVACDHYNRYEEDLDLIAGANLDHYRFSVSWARVMPDGETVNPEGLDFYDRLTDAMLARGIKPMLTLHHWDMPAALADKGGWRNREVASWFGDLTDHVVNRIGDRMWASGTFNEPWCITWLSHFHGAHAPGMRDVRATARAIHHLLLAHAQSMDVMRSRGMNNLGIYLNFEPALPAAETEASNAAAARYHAYYNSCFLQPLMGRGYPDAMLEGIEPHLPDKWQNDMDAFAAPLDWLGINNYTRKLVDDDGSSIWPYFKEVEGPLTKTEMDWEVAPDSFGWLLDWVASETNGLPLYVTENGMAGPEQFSDDGGTCDDPERLSYFQAYVGAMRRAIANGAPVKGYTVWSLLDNYEWALGYEKRFGIVHVDYDTLHRTPKASWHAWKAAMER
ncbi:MAG: GH1 family beta-glucosidase [Pseudomonadota bacterium]